VTESRLACVNKPSAFDGEPFPGEDRPNAVSDVALKLHGAIAGRSAGATGALQLLGQLFQKDRVSREIVDNRYGLSAAARLLDAQLRDDSIGD